MGLIASWSSILSKTGYGYSSGYCPTCREIFDYRSGFKICGLSTPSSVYDMYYSANQLVQINDITYNGGGTTTKIYTITGKCVLEGTSNPPSNMVNLRCDFCDDAFGNSVIYSVLLPIYTGFNPSTGYFSLTYEGTSLPVRLNLTITTSNDAHYDNSNPIYLSNFVSGTNVLLGTIPFQVA